MLRPYSCLVMGNGWITPPSYRPGSNSHISVPIATFLLAWALRVNFFSRLPKKFLSVAPRTLYIIAHDSYRPPLSFELPSAYAVLSSACAFFHCTSTQTHAAESFEIM
jgi:hypothetical protein